MVEAKDVPTIPVIGQEWKVYVFCLGAFVVVIVTAVMGMAKRALILQARDLLTSEVFFFWEWWDLPLQLIALAELLLVCSGLLFYAMTSYQFVFLTACILPLILGTGMQVLSQWVYNDYKLLEPVDMRLEEDSDDESDNEEESGQQQSGGQITKSASSLFGSVKNAATGMVEEAGVSLPPLTKTAGQIGKKIAMPSLPFRSPVKKAKKKDRSNEGGVSVTPDVESEATETSALIPKATPASANPFALATAKQGEGKGGGGGFSNPFAKATAGHEAVSDDDQGLSLIHI